MAKKIDILITTLRYKKIKGGETTLDMKNANGWQSYNAGDTLVLCEYEFNKRKKAMQVTGRALERQLVGTEPLKCGVRLVFK